MIYSYTKNKITIQLHSVHKHANTTWAYKSYSFLFILIYVLILQKSVKTVSMEMRVHGHLAKKTIWDLSRFFPFCVCVAGWGAYDAMNSVYVI